jgi:hypothetical protein
MIFIYLIMPLMVIGLSILIASLHMVAPDHWTPILSYSIGKKLKLRKTGFISFSLGMIHGVFSAILSFAIAIVGLYFFPELYLKIFAVALLVFVAVYIIINARHEEKIEKNTEIEKSILLVSVIPDPAIVPIILIAVVYGMHFVYLTLSIFVIVSAVALLLVTIALSRVLIKKLATLTPKRIDYLVAAILLGTTIFVLL